MFTHTWLSNTLVKLYFKDVKKTTGLVEMIQILAFCERVERVTHLDIFDHADVFLQGLSVQVFSTWTGLEEDPGGMDEMPVLCWNPLVSADCQILETPGEKRELVCQSWDIYITGAFKEAYIIG